MAEANPNQDMIESVPGRYTDNEYQAILSKFDMVVIANLHDEDFVDFGIMDSKKYATKLFRLMEQQGLNEEEFTMAVVLATAVKSKKRILNAMRKFQGLGWYRNVLNFYTNNVCQYTFEEHENSISVVHFSSSLPFLAARIWLQITREPTVEAFLNNLWAAQIYLSEDLMLRQKAWEQGFWTNTVKKGGKLYEGGADTGKFNPEYWKTKAADYYLLLNADGTRFSTNPRTLLYEVAYNEADIQAWINTRSVPAPRAARAPRQPPGGGAAGPGGPPPPQGPPRPGNPGGPNAQPAQDDPAVVEVGAAVLPGVAPGADDPAVLAAKVAVLPAVAPVAEQEQPQQQQQPLPGQQPQQQQPPAQGGGPQLPVPDPPAQQHLGPPGAEGLGQGGAEGGTALERVLAKFSLDQLGKAASDPMLAFLFDAHDEEEEKQLAEMSEDELRDRKTAIVDSILEREVEKRLGLDVNEEKLSTTFEPTRDWGEDEDDQEY
jgi:hypothetical protein